MKIAMLLLAAGRGARFGGAVPKAFLPLGGRPLLLASAERLVAAMGPGDSWELLVLVHPGDRDTHVAGCLPALRTIVGNRGAMRVIDGGDTRQASVQRGLAATSPATELVLVHDAARAL
ncbi:MAG: 2-C-methyl-D-erythritol 4-phosphate cytidylyltransferase, partial [Planctomycetota bacterium]